MSNEKDDKQKRQSIETNDDFRKIFQAIGLIAHLGITMMVNIGIGYLLGYFLDNLLHAEITYKILGSLLGTASGFYSVYRLVMNFFKD